MELEQQVSKEDMNLIGYVMDDMDDHCICLAKMMQNHEYDPAHAQWILDWLLREYDPILVKHFYPHFEGFDILQATREAAALHTELRTTASKNVIEGIAALTP